jgi:hypothetical protein
MNRADAGTNESLIGEGGGDEKPHWQHLLEQAWEQIERDGDLPLDPPVEEVIRQMREERDAQLLAGLKGVTNEEDCNRN